MKNKKVGTVEEVAVNTLKFFEGNPKKFKSKTFARLVASIKEIGVQEPIYVNVNTNTVINGNQRLKACMQLGIKNVKVIWCDIDPKDEAKVLVHLNKTLAEYDEDGFYSIMQKYQDDPFMKDLLKDYAVAVKNMQKNNMPEFEIVREVDESYDYMMFIAKRGIDYSHLETFFNLGQVFDPHRERLIGMGRVVDAEILIKLIQVAYKQGIKNATDL